MLVVLGSLVVVYGGVYLWIVHNDTFNRCDAEGCNGKVKRHFVVVCLECMTTSKHNWCRRCVEGSIVKQHCTSMESMVTLDAGERV